MQRKCKENAVAFCDGFEFYLPRLPFLESDCE